MATSPRRPTKRKTDAPRDAVADRATIAKPADPRQAGLFDAPLPKWIRPCLPTLVDRPPIGPQWVHEIKWDGYRVSVYVADGKATVRTRKGLDWTSRFPAIAAAAERLPVRSAVIDGEAVILDEKGRSSFAELQADLTKHGSQRAVLYAFDLLFLDGEVLWKKPLEERRDALAGMMPSKFPILFSEVLRRRRRRSVQDRLRERARGHRLEAARPRLPFRPLPRLAEDKVRAHRQLRRNRLSAGYRSRPDADRQHQDRALRRRAAALRRRGRDRVQRGGSPRRSGSGSIASRRQPAPCVD